MQESLGDVFVHANGGTEDARTDEGQPSKIKQALDGSVLAESAVHHGENHVDALAAAAAIELDERGVSGVGGHHDALPALQNFGEHFLGACTDEPVAFFCDADRHGFVLVRVEATNHGCC